MLASSASARGADRRDPPPGHRDAGEQALEYGVPPLVGVQVPGRVGAEGGGEQRGVVGAQGVLDQRQSGAGSVSSPSRACRTARRSSAVPRWYSRVTGSASGRAAVQHEYAGGVGVFGAAAAARLGEAQLPHRDGAGVPGGPPPCRGSARTGRLPEPREGGAQVGGRARPANSPGRSASGGGVLARAVISSLRPAQEPHRRAAQFGSRVGVPGQFDDGQALVAGGGEGVEYGREVDLAVPEGQVFVDAAAHVLDLHVPQPGRGGPYAVGGRQGLQALAVPDVEGQSQCSGSPSSCRRRWKSVECRPAGGRARVRPPAVRRCPPRPPGPGRGLPPAVSRPSPRPSPAGRGPLKQCTACAPRSAATRTERDQQAYACPAGVRVASSRLGPCLRRGSRT
ncbi:hypothetical protein SROCM77S_01131 [Streptomyces rochei]